MQVQLQPSASCVSKVSSLRQRTGKPLRFRPVVRTDASLASLWELPAWAVGVVCGVTWTQKKPASLSGSKVPATQLNAGKEGSSGLKSQPDAPEGTIDTEPPMSSEGIAQDWESKLLAFEAAFVPVEEDGMTIYEPLEFSDDEEEEEEVLVTAANNGNRQGAFNMARESREYAEEADREWLMLTGQADDAS